MHEVFEGLAPPLIGPRHPLIRQIRRVINNATPVRHQCLVAEGLWAHEVVLGLGAAAEAFLWCPELAYSDEAHRLRVPVIEFDTPSHAAEWLRRKGFTVYLATLGERALAYHDIRFGARTAIVVGNERHGIAPAWYDHGVEATVPMYGQADSLNVSVSASILLYEARRQHRVSRGSGRLLVEEGEGDGGEQR
jgi:tRNA(Leu) C34 or U34 (ribose-2'-O)-methylase TrmL